MYTFSHSMHPDYISKWIDKPRRTTYVNFDNIKITQKEDGLNKKKENLNKGFKKNRNLSVTSQKKIINSIKWLNYVANKKTYITKNGKKIQYKLQFITLTLSAPQKHDDRIIVKEILGKFLNECRNKYDLNNYIWRAEKQKNGNIHFHIVTDCGMNYWRILSVWNRCQNLLGYVDDFKINNPDSNHPNSVDVKKVLNDKHVERYITKYVTKPFDKNNPNNEEDENQILTCRHYAVSYSLSNFKEFRKNTKQLSELIYAHARILAKEVEKEFCSYIPISLKRISSLWGFIGDEILKQLNEICNLRPSKLLSTWEMSQQQYNLTFSA